MTLTVCELISDFINNTNEYQRVLRRRMEDLEDKEFEGILQKLKSVLLPSKAISRLEKRLNSTESERATAISKISNLNLEIDSKQLQLLSFGEKIAEASVVVETQAAQIAELNLKLSTSINKNKATKDNIASLKAKENSHKQRETELLLTIQLKDNEIQQSNEGIVTLQVTIASLRESLRNANHLIKELERDVANATNTSSMLISSKQDLEIQLENAAKEWSAITTSTALKNTQPQLTTIAPPTKAPSEELLETIESQRILLHDAQDEVDELMREISECRKRNDELSDKNSQLSEEVSQLEDKNRRYSDDLEEKTDQLTKAAEDADFAAGSAKRAEQSVAAMDAHVALLQGKLEASQESMASKDDHLTAKEAVLSSITYSNDQNEMTITHLEAQLSDVMPKYEIARTELEHVRDELVQRSAEIHSQNRKINELERENRLSKGELETRVKTETIFRVKAEELRADAESVRMRMLGEKGAFDQDSLELRDALRSTKADLHKQRLLNGSLSSRLRESERAIVVLEKEAMDTVAVLKDALTDAQHEINENRMINKRIAEINKKEESILRTKVDTLQSYISTTTTTPPPSTTTPVATATAVANSNATWEPVAITDLILSVPRTTHSVRPTPAPFSPII